MNCIVGGGWKGEGECSEWLVGTRNGASKGLRGCGIRLPVICLVGGAVDSRDRG